MPAHTSHLLQLLNISCYTPLKRVYRHKVQELTRQSVYHINKEDFLSIYVKVRTLIFHEESIKSGFQAAGLVPFNPQRVLSSLTVINKTPSPPGMSSGEQ